MVDTNATKTQTLGGARRTLTIQHMFLTIEWLEHHPIWAFTNVHHLPIGRHLLKLPLPEVPLFSPVDAIGTPADMQGPVLPFYRLF